MSQNQVPFNLFAEMAIVDLSKEVYHPEVHPDNDLVIGEANETIKRLDRVRDKIFWKQAHTHGKVVQLLNSEDESFELEDSKNTIRENNTLLAIQLGIGEIIDGFLKISYPEHATKNLAIRNGDMIVEIVQPYSEDA